MIVGLGEAAAVAQSELDKTGQKMLEMRNYLETRMLVSSLFKNKIPFYEIAHVKCKLVVDKTATVQK